MLQQSTHRIIQLSDTHFTANREPLFGKVDCDANLAAAFERIADSGAQVDAIIMSGDLADKGDPSAYRRLRTAIAAAEARFGCPILPGMGNHDNRPIFRAELLQDSLGDQHVDYVTDVRGLRIINIDSSVPGKGHGFLETDQLQWLAEQLAQPAEHGSILVIHHPPIPIADAKVASIGFKSPDELAQVLAGSDVRLIVSGHWHTVTAATFAGIPVMAGPSLGYPTDPMAGAFIRGTAQGQSFTVLEVFPSTIATTNVPIDRYETLFEIAREPIQ